jgi:trimeric autotransporter adhesin
MVSNAFNLANVAPNTANSNVGIATTSTPLTLTVAGDIAATRNVYSNYSDLRLKNKIGDITAAVDKVKHIDTLYYEPNELAQSLGSSTGRHIGVTAQSVQAVVPESIGPSPLDTQYMTVQYERLVPLLIEAVKAQQAQIADLQQRVADLEGRPDDH